MVGFQNGTASQDYVVFAIMLYRLRKGALLLGFCPTKHNISEAAALPGPIEFASGARTGQSIQIQCAVSTFLCIFKVSLDLFERLAFRRWQKERHCQKIDHRECHKEEKHCRVAILSNDW